jgi:hypothetical protein
MSKAILLDDPGFDPCRARQWFLDNLGDRCTGRGNPIFIFSRLHEQDEVGSIDSEDLKGFKQLVIDYE